MSVELKPCPRCKAPCHRTVEMRGGDYGWSTSDEERATYRHATQPPAVGVDVSEETVRRIARAVADWASVAGDPEPDAEMMDELCDTVTAALRTGGGA